MPSLNNKYYTLALCIFFIFITVLSVFPSPAQPVTLKERDMTVSEPLIAKATVLNNEWIQLYLPEKVYNKYTVTNTENYSITGSDDPNYTAPLHPVQVCHRYWPENAPYNAQYSSNQDIAHINVICRVFLKVAQPLKNNKNYTITIDTAVLPAMSLTCSFDDSTPNEVIHVNQEAYVAPGTKTAYLSWWLGYDSIDFSQAKTFYLINEDTVQSVYTGTVQFIKAGADEKWGKSNLYALDFTDYNEEGNYHLYVPGVGRSYSFKISTQAYNDIGYTVFRGLTMQRDGNHGLDSPAVTHWTRPPAHLDDAIDENSQTRVDLTGGHMDAGDRGKYPWSMADASCSLLSAMQLFPEKIEALGENLQIPESDNGIPDYIDETVYELDFLYKAIMNTSGDGTLPTYLRPANKGYEEGVPPEGLKGRVFFNATYGPNRGETLYAAGALAMAANTPLIQKYCPDRCQQYKEAALKAFDGFAKHSDDMTFWCDYNTDPFEGTHKWSDEMLVAAANLYQLTGDSKYYDWIKSELPADLTKTKRWGWSLEGPWLYAYLSLYKINVPGFDPAIKDNAYKAMINWADAVMSYETPYGAPLIDDCYSRVGWYFTGSMTTYPLMLAHGISEKTKYREQIITNWNYLLGTNPLSRPFISGLGNPQRSPRWLVHEISQYKWLQYAKGNQSGWSEMVPGLPNADLQNGDYPYYYDDDWNAARKEKKHPAQSNYPPLYRYSDGWNTTNEFTIMVLAREAASLVPLLYSEDTAQNHTLTVSGSHGKVTVSIVNSTAGLNNLAEHGNDKVNVLIANDTESTLLPIENNLAKSATINETTNHLEKIRNPSVQNDTMTSINLKANATLKTEENSILVQAAYAPGTDITLKAWPDEGYKFAGWQGDAGSLKNPLELTINDNKNITAVFIPAMDAPYKSLDIGTTYAGTTEEKDKIITVKGSGGDLWGLSDSFRYVYQDNLKGDAEIIARIDSLTAKADNAKAGILIRQSTEKNSNNQGIMVTKGGLYYSQCRDGEYWTIRSAQGAINLPVWLKLVKNETLIETFYSSDGINWTKAAGNTPNFNSTSDQFTAGIFACAGWQGDYATADFSNITWPGKINLYTVTTQATGGTVVLNPSKEMYPEGEKVTVTAQPEPGYFFSGWNGDLSDSVNPTDITVDGDKNITADFKKYDGKYCLSDLISLARSLGTTSTDVKYNTQADLNNDGKVDLADLLLLASSYS